MIRELEYIQRYKDIELPEDIQVEYFVNKRGKRMVRSTRHIATKTGHQIKSKLLEAGHNVSYGTVCANFA